jgi:hypothetical protein
MLESQALQRNMFNADRLVAILCLAVLAGTLLSVAAFDILWVLPALAVLVIALPCSEIQKFTGAGGYLPVLRFPSLSLRAPPSN